jgi:zinc protease
LSVATVDPATESRLEIAVRGHAGAPICALRLWLFAGSRLEGIPGEATVTGRLLSEGTLRRDWRQLADDLEDRGIALSSFATAEAVGLGLDSLADDWEIAIDTAAEIFAEAALPEDRFEWLREQAAAELESLGDQPEVRAGWAFLDQIYRPHPLARPVLGTPEGLAALSLADCQAHLAAACGRGGVLVVAGAIDEASVAARLEERFGSVAAPANHVHDHDRAPLPLAPLGNGLRHQEVAVGGVEQAHLLMGHLTVSRRDPDIGALEVLAVVLGAGEGLAGRIPQRVREREGLAYTTHVSTLSGAGLDPGRFVVYIGTAEATVERARLAVVEELTRVLEDGLTETEVSEAKSYLLAREPFRRETGRQWADLLAEARFYGEPYDSVAWVRHQIEDVDRERAEAVARRHLSLERLVTTVGLPRPVNGGNGEG